jgi:hypothetical protein
MLASSFASSTRDDGDNKPITGKSTKETVKTIVRGMPGESGVTVVTISCAFLFCTRGCGASSARHSLRPLMLRWHDVQKNSGAFALRECGIVSCRHCERSEAIHLRSGDADPWIASLPLAMTFLVARFLAV